MNLESSHENTVDERPLPDHEDKKDTQATNIKDSNDNPTITITDEDPKPRCQSKNSMEHSRTNMPLLNSHFQYIRKEEVPYFSGQNIHYSQKSLKEHEIMSKSQQGTYARYIPVYPQYISTNVQVNVENMNECSQTWNRTGPTQLT
jgi:hypothetical protein